jgi:hypothetical protein
LQTDGAGHVIHCLTVDVTGVHRKKQASSQSNAAQALGA